VAAGEKVVDERPVRPQRLWPNPGRSGLEVGSADLREVPADLPRECPPDEIAVHLGQAHSPVAPRESPERPRAQRLEGVARVDVAPPVALARERDDGVRARPDLAVGAAADVDAQEREARVGNGIDEVSAEATRLRAEREVVPAERHDRRRVLHGGRGDLGEPVGLEARAADDERRLQVAARRGHANAALLFAHPRHTRPQRHVSARGLDPVAQPLSHEPKIDEASRRNVQGHECPAVRLELA
jgi:hypothetical protein